MKTTYINITAEDGTLLDRFPVTLAGEVGDDDTLELETVGTPFTNSETCQRIARAIRRNQELQ